MKINLLKKARNLGFTMIELLIVISILGILAVAVLSAINPIEQINRGRDTGSRSDAEQLLSAIDRFYAFNGYYPWQTSADSDEGGDPAVSLTSLDMGSVLDGDDCDIMYKLAGGDPSDATCVGSDEIKDTFISRITGSDYNSLSLYNQGNTGDSTYLCFVPKSDAFRKEAKDRCDDATGTGLPDDIDDTTAGTLCAGVASDDADIYVCLP